jgi:hypothetical protein
MNGKARAAGKTEAARSSRVVMLKAVPEVTLDLG